MMPSYRSRSVAAPARNPILLALLLILGCAVPASAQDLKSEISQFGITWKFDKSYEVGQYANGDWWVVGPIKVVSIDPPSRSGSRVMNGSMINPSPTLGNRQGYDSQMKHCSYSASLNVALDVSSSKPLSVPVNSSLVSTSSVSKVQTPQLQAGQILTVVSAPAKSGDFRPPYCGKDKRSPFNVSELDFSLLASLKPTAKTPSLSSVERYFERPWLDHMPGWNGTEHHPINNMPHYGRELTQNMGIGALMLHLDFTTDKKRTLLTRFVQVGIDLQGVVDDGGHRNWMNNGGHASGRKWPILFAGLVLHDEKMKSIGSKDVWFGEDMQTWVVTQADVGRKLDPDPRAPKTLYTQSHVGKAEWGIRHATSPISDNANWGATYRTCCTANVWYGFLLAAMIMDARGLWNHEPLFLYQDRYLSESRRLKIPDWQISYNDWSLEMWDTYRSTAENQWKVSFLVRNGSAYEKPRGVHAGSPKPKEVRLTWTKPGGTSAKHTYRIYRGAVASSLQLVEKDVETLFYTDPALAGGQTWYYAVAVVDENGREISRSSPIQVKT